MSKKYLDISISIFPVTIIFCPTKEIQENYTKKYHSWMSDEQREYDSNANTLVVTEEGQLSLIVSLDNVKDVYEAKSLIVHELSHVVTETFKFLYIDCDETRSYMLQGLYKDVMKFYDKYLDKKENKV